MAKPSGTWREPPLPKTTTWVPICPARPRASSRYSCTASQSAARAGQAQAARKEHVHRFYRQGRRRPPWPSGSADRPRSWPRWSTAAFRYNRTRPFSPPGSVQIRSHPRFLRSANHIHRISLRTFRRLNPFNRISGENRQQPGQIGLTAWAGAVGLHGQKIEAAQGGHYIHNQLFPASIFLRQRTGPQKVLQQLPAKRRVPFQ